MKRVSYQKWSMKLIIGLLIFLLLPYQAWAETWEYYTYGGYNAVVDAWRKVGLIFSDSRFVGLFFSVIALGIIILYFMVIARVTLSGSSRFNLAGWAIPVMIGMAVYIAFIVPKDRIVVYDPVLNRGPETIGNIPRIMAMTAGLLNKIEKGMIDIVRTATTPVEDYARNAGGTGFIILSQFGGQVAVLAGIPTHIWMTATKFIEDCVFFELRRPGTTLTKQQIENGEKPFTQIIQESKNPGVPTVYYDETGKEVDTTGSGSVTCQEAGDKLLTYLREANLEEVVKKACILSGFNIDNPAEWNQCRTLVESAYRDGLRGATNGAGNLNLLVAQKLLAESLFHVLHTINPESGIRIMATREAGSQYFGLIVHANTWLPIIKETLRAAAIALSPFVLLFAVTPLVGRALGFMLGMMVWVVTWSVIDAILHYAAVSQAVAASQEFSGVITNGTPGTIFFTLLPSYSSKVAAAFGAIRWAGLGLATVLTAMLIRFGGAALAMVAGSITGTVQSAGAAMGRMVTDVTSPIRADLVPTASWTNAAVAAGGIAPLARGLVALQAGSLAGQADAGNLLSFQTIRSGTAASTVEPLTKGAVLGVQKAIEAGRIAGEQRRGEVSKKLELENKYGAGLFKLLGEIGATREVETSLGERDVAQAHNIPLEVYYRERAHGAHINLDTYAKPYGPMMLRLSDGSYIIIQRPPSIFSITSNVGLKDTLNTSSTMSERADKKTGKESARESRRFDGWTASEELSDEESEARSRGHGTNNTATEGTAGRITETSGHTTSLNFNPSIQGAGAGQRSLQGGGQEGGGGDGSSQGKRKRLPVSPSAPVTGGAGIVTSKMSTYEEYSGGSTERSFHRRYDYSHTFSKSFNYHERWGEEKTSFNRETTQASISQDYSQTRSFNSEQYLGFSASFNVDNLALKIYADRHPELSKLDEKIRYAEAEKRLQEAFYTGNKEEIELYYEAVNIAQSHFKNMMPPPAQNVSEHGPKVEREVEKEMKKIKEKVTPPNPKKPKRKNK